MVTEPPNTVIVVGVQPAQGDSVLDVAATLAARLGSRLICVWVDPSMLSSGFRADGSEVIESIDPDVADGRQQRFPDRDAELVEQVAGRHGVTAEVLSRVGDPARILGEVAAEQDASMIVVGTQTGRRRIAEFFNGSVAARLSHQQHRPVVVVPIDPVGFGAPLPWDVP